VTVNDTTYFTSQPCSHVNENKWANTFKFLELSNPKKFNYTTEEITAILERKKKIKKINNAVLEQLIK